MGFKLMLKAVFIFVVLLIAGIILQQTGKKTAEDVEINLSPEVNAEQLCYIWNTEAGDKAMLSIDVRDENVIGEFYWLPAEKDSKTGIFRGTISSGFGQSRTVDAIWEAGAEGVVNSEEMKIHLDGGIAKVTAYEGLIPASYPNLQLTDCGDEAMD